MDSNSIGHAGVLCEKPRFDDSADLVRASGDVGQMLAACQLEHRRRLAVVQPRYAKSKASMRPSISSSVRRTDIGSRLSHRDGSASRLISPLMQS